MGVDRTDLHIRAPGHQIVMHGPDHLTLHAQRIRARKHIERHSNRPLKGVLHRDKRRIHRTCLYRTEARPDIAIADNLAIEPLPFHEIACRRLAVRPHGAEHPHRLSHLHALLIQKRCTISYYMYGSLTSLLRNTFITISSPPSIANML